MAKTNKKTAEKATKEKVVKQEVVVEEKKRGRPKKEEEKLPTASLKELEDQGSNYVIDETPKEEQEEQVQEPEQEIVSDSIEVQNSQESISSTTTEDNDTALENTNDETHEEFLNKQAELMAQDISNKIDSEIVDNIVSVAETLQLSPMAQKYKAYIEYTKMTPEQFIAKYPNHKFIRCVHEIIEWKVKTGAQ